jgi:PmbA protein
MATIAKRESLGRTELEGLVTLALDEARRLGVDQAEVVASQDMGLTATARLGEAESLEYTNDRGVGITVYKDSRKGNASTSVITPEAIREAVAKACTFANLTAEDKYAGLADAELMCQDVRDLDLDHPWTIDADTAIAMAIESESAGLQHDKRVSNSEGATVSTNRGTHAYGNTHGFVGSYTKTSHSISCVLLAESDGVMQRDYHYTTARCAEDLDTAAAVGRTAADKVVGRLGARKLKTVRAPVLFIPELARGFIGHAIGAIAGGAQYRRSSFLLDAVGEKLFPDFVSILERPHLPRGLASVPYDGEGVGTYDRDIVTDGVLQAYVLSSYSARRLGLTTTANAGGAQNLIVPGSRQDKASLISEMGTGLVVQELIGQGVNGVTGDYSRGAVGHWVENGEIAYPVHEVTIAGNLRDLYQRIAAIGDDQDMRGGIRCGSLLVEEMTIAGA